MIILGLDPGSYHTGYAVLEVSPQKILYRTHGVISLAGRLSFAERIHLLSQELDRVFSEHKPNSTVIERIFLGRNVDSAFKLGHVRGVCLLLAAQFRSEIVEYAARSVKKGVTGRGTASKEEVQVVLQRLLGVRFVDQVRMGWVREMPRITEGVDSLDASDALALAYHHACQLEISARLEAANLRRRTMSQP